MLENIPRELRERANFVLWKYIERTGEKPTKPPFNAKSGWPASVTNAQTWSTYDVAVNALSNGGGWQGLGYVISPDDPFTFIDLDTHDPKLDDAERERHGRIAAAFKGYAEISPSGKGLHLIVRGKVPSGRRRGGVEIYSAERYMTLTGNVWRHGEIIEQQDLLNILWAELGPTNNASEIVTAYNTEQTETDAVICDRAYNAVNGPKFLTLYNGQWQAEYSSQSEADFALIDILGFYSQNREQIKRIFRASALGKRDKAKRDSYLDSMIARSFDNLPPPINLDALKLSLTAQIEAKQVPASVSESAVSTRGANGLAFPADDPQTPTDEVYSLPPGLLGEIAQYVYASAPRPVKEVALTAAIGLMSGICGRSYNVSGTGLNHYILLLAPTGSGKESIAHGISMLMESVAKIVPSSLDFIGPGDIRSDVSLVKWLAHKSPSFVTIGGEFGHTLSQMSREANNAMMRGIKRMMLDLYGKSGKGATLQPTIYSDMQKNTLVLGSPAFSFIGESAPESFFESVDERLVSDGLLPRFTMIEYRGQRPHLNEQAGFEPSKALIDKIGALCVQSLTLNKGGKVIDVTYTPEAKALLDAYDKNCTSLINTGEREVIRHLWNRAHLRALKLAACIAVGTNPYAPVIDLAAANWAIRLSSHNTNRLLARFATGDVGAANSDSNQLNHLYKVCHDWLTRPLVECRKVFDHPGLFEAKIIPQSYLQRRLVNYSAFKNDRMGATNAVKKCIQAALDGGILSEPNKLEIAKALTLRVSAM